MKKIVAIYTGQGLAGPLQKLIEQALPSYKLVNIIDDGIIHDVIADKGVSKAVTRRLAKYYQIAAEMGANVILNTCSSIGDAVEIAQPIVDVPIIRIDEQMAKHAAQNYSRIGVIATLETTLEPTTRLIRTQAKLLGKQVTVVDGLAQGAYQALVAGKHEEHDKLILDASRRLASKVECIVLAQASMMRMQEQLEKMIGIPVIASPPLCITHMKSLLENSQL